MSRPTVTVISPKGEASNDTIPVPQVFKASLTILSLAAIKPAHALLRPSNPRIFGYFAGIEGGHTIEGHAGL